MLKIRAVQLRVSTSGPMCGIDIPFRSGLNILRADNSSGKSTALQAIMYALGLEGMLSPKREIPLPHAMTDEIEVDGRPFPVERSFVRLEIENLRGEVVTVHRVVRAEDVDSRLITVMQGPAITENLANLNRKDYFVRMAGAAQRQAGFHHFLADFVGWRLPRVTKNDGSEVLLYVECLFPYSFVEQKQGWLNVQPRIPSYFQIRDVVRRSAEFTLNLDAYGLALTRQRLEYARSAAETEWNQAVRQIEADAATASVVLNHVPRGPAEVGDLITVEALVAQGDGQWLTVDAELERLRAIFESIELVPRVGPAARSLESELSEATEKLNASNAALVNAASIHDSVHIRAAHLQERVSALEEDLQRHKDAALLQRLGSRHSALFGNEPHCPTCNQFLPDGFDITTTPMSTADNISFIEQEVATFRNMHRDAIRAEEVETVRLRRLRDESNALRAQIRSIKDTLVAPSALPSIAAITQRIRVEEQMSALRKFADGLGGMLEELVGRGKKWQRINRELKDLGSDPMSPLDREKIGFINESFRDQLRAYRFSSMSPDNVSISEDTYRPVHEGFDLGFDLSASDMVRAMWAYLLSFAEASLKHSTNHLGMLVLDEPRQQEVHRTDFSAFLQRLARDGSDGLQVIVATSEEHDRLLGMLAGTPNNMLSLPPGVKVLRPL